MNANPYRTWQSCGSRLSYLLHSTCAALGFKHKKKVAMSEWPASSTQKNVKKKIPSGYLT
jgi:ribosomal protein L37E